MNLFQLCFGPMLRAMVLSIFGIDDAIVIGAGLGISALAKGIGSLFSGNAEQQANDANAHAVEQQAGFSQLATDQNVNSQILEGARQTGSIRAAYGASGVKQDGSAQDVQDFASGINRIKLLNIEMRGAAEQYAYKNAENNYLTGAANADTSKWLNFGGDIAGGVGKIFASTYGGAKIAPSTKTDAYGGSVYGNSGSVSYGFGL